MASKVISPLGVLSRKLNLQRSCLYLPIMKFTPPRRMLSSEFLSHYEKVPSLPVPELQSTLDRYLKTVKPLLSEHQFSITKQVAKNFGAPGGVGAKLQQLLQKKGSAEDNWLTNWWLDVAYLSYRLPVVVHSNPGLIFPKQNFNSVEEQLIYAAKLIAGSLQYKALIDEAKIKQDFLGKNPLDMSQYMKVFNTCRIPGLKKDSLSQNLDSRHITVVHNNHFSKMDVYRANGELIDENQILSNLLEIVRQSPHKTEPVGVLTTENRNVWASAYLKLKRDGTNSASLTVIEDSIFLMCLDQAVPDQSGITPESRQATHVLHGSGSLNNSGNRWFDKTLQLLVGADGTSGLCYEHSPAEGPPMANLADYIVSYAQDKTLAAVNNLPVSNIQMLSFKISSEVSDIIEDAKENIDLLVQDVEISSFTFDAFGKEDIKTLKLSPDSFIQIAIQMAYIKMYGSPTAHYESASTRKFTSGRTETIRTCLPEIVDFAADLLNSKGKSPHHYNALQSAMKAHKEYVLAAINGQGVDRHLLGLKMTAIENGMDIPSIYLDPAYSVSNNWRLSTSQVAAKHDMVMCYGPTAPDGYGCCYNPRRDQINFAVSSFVSSPTTSSQQFAEALSDSLTTLRDVASSNMPSKL